MSTDRTDPAAPAAGDLEPLVARLRAAGCVFAEDEAALLLEAAARPEPAARRRSGGADAVDGDRLEELVARRVAGEPLEHVLGRVEFAGRSWSVGRGVFVPRRRTELMVGAALALPAPATVLDLCCGCGAVGGAVLLGLRAAGAAPVLHASDVEPAAVVHARRNLGPLGAAVHEGDLLSVVPAMLRGRVDLLLCNAPYVPTGAIATMPPEARDHEPAVALDGGADGLDVLRRVVAAAPGWLAPGGSLLFEVGTGQVEGATALVEAHGLRATVVTDDDPDADDATGGTVVVATVT
ncbi:putative protein N(5)-glutamine methyltransferase [Isoptericola sp. NPDC056573]|uniref:putative protein N(5)-glutamine methyltransferase n=1 Tax=unclassified Isoptericola TaxID=2623355 RepID=UPI0036AB4A0C